MKRLVLLCGIAFCVLEAFGQSVGISDVSFTPNTQSILDLSSDRKGFLPPRVDLDGPNAPINGTKPAGLMVYNSGGDIGPDGIYYWTGSAWVQVSTSSGTVAGSGTLNYIPKWTPDGTTLGNSQVFDNGTNIGIGTSVTSSKLSIAGTTSIYNQSGGLLIDTDGDAELHIGEQMDVAGTSGEAVRLALQPYGHTGGPFNFVTRDDASSAYVDLRYGNTGAASSLFSLKHDGNLGLGSSTPAYKLDVKAGSGKASIESSSDAPLRIKGTNSWSGIEFSDVSATDYIWYNGGNSTYAIGGGGSNVSGKKLHIDGATSIGSSYDGQVAPTDGLSVEGNTGLGTTTATHRLEVNGNVKLGDNMMVEGNSSWRVYRNLATYNSSSSGANGAFVINTTQPWNSACMFKVKVEGYFYDATSPFEMTIGGYMYNNNSFYNKGYINVGAKDLAVRFARNTSTNTIAIILGNEGSAYSYPKISVTSFMQGHSTPNEAYADGWTISQQTSLGGFDNITSVPNVTTLPSGDGNYIQNQLSSAQSANFWVSGNSGVGGTSPTAKLHVSGGGQIIGTNGSSSNTRTLTVLSDGQAQINHGSYPGAWTSALQIQNNDNSDYVWLSPLDDANNARLLAYGSGLDFYTGSNAYAMTLTSNGNLGINTTNPASKLHINGSSLKLASTANETPYTILGYANGSSLWFISGANTSSTAVIGTSHDWDRQVALAYTPGTTGAAGGNFQIGQLSKNNTNYTHGTTSFYTNGSERMRINSSGYVGIATTSPATKLQIAHTSSGGLTGTSAYAGIHLDQDASNDGFTGITSSATSSGTQGGILFQGSGSYGTKIHFMTTSSYASGMQQRMTLNHVGNLGIGTSSPSYRLHVYGPASNYPAYVGSPDGYLQFGPANTGWCHFQTDRPNFYFNTGLYVNGGRVGSYSGDLTLHRAGTNYVILSANYLDVYTNYGVTAWDYYFWSDKNLKKNIRPLYNTLDALAHINGVYFNYDKEKFGEEFPSVPEEQQIGFLAQEVKEYFPELVTQRENGYYTVDYVKMTPVLVEAIKELHEQIKEKDAKIEDLDNRLKQIEAQLKK